MKNVHATALARLIQDVLNRTFTVQNKPAAVAPKGNHHHHFLRFRIGRRKPVDAAKILYGAENVETETQQTFVNDRSVLLF